MSAAHCGGVPVQQQTALGCGMWERCSAMLFGPRRLPCAGVAGGGNPCAGRRWGVFFVCGVVVECGDAGI